MKPTLVDAIDITEKTDLRFPYAKEMELGETIANVVISVTLLSGVDATPNLTVVGVPTIVAASFDVLQRVQGRVSGVTYKLKCVATLSSGRVLTRILILPVNDY